MKTFFLFKGGSVRPLRQPGTATATATLSDIFIMRFSGEISPETSCTIYAHQISRPLSKVCFL